jgi:chromate transport protein ChrA
LVFRRSSHGFRDLSRSSSLPSVVSLFSGIQTLIVANATGSFGKTSLNEFNGAVIAGIVAAVVGAGTTPILVILLAALLGLLLHKSECFAEIER